MTWKLHLDISLHLPHQKVPPDQALPRRLLGPSAPTPQKSLLIRNVNRTGALHRPSPRPETQHRALLSSCHDPTAPERRSTSWSSSETRTTAGKARCLEHSFCVSLKTKVHGLHLWGAMRPKTRTLWVISWSPAAQVTPASPALHWHPRAHGSHKRSAVIRSSCSFHSRVFPQTVATQATP